MAQSNTRAALLTLVAALLWGLWWIPVRWLETQGLEAAWTSALFGLGAALAMLPFARFGRITIRLFLGAICVGIALTNFTIAVTEGEVARVVLFFYLAPVWSKIIEWAAMGRRWHRSSTLALVLSFAGVLMLTGGAQMGGLSLGDILGLIAGLSWAVGAALVHGGGQAGAATLSALSALIAAGVALVYAVFSLPLPPLDADIAIGLGLGVIYFMPILFLTLKAAETLAPAALSFILSAEIVTGVASAAILLDEPFTLFHLAGAMLIVAGALAELFAGAPTADFAES